jgi:hypothetical protein
LRKADFAIVYCFWILKILTLAHNKLQPAVFSSPVVPEQFLTTTNKLQLLTDVSLVGQLKKPNSTLAMKKALRVLLLIPVLFVFSSFQGNETMVYLCDSSSATAYHFNRNCRGLSNCKHEIIKVTKQDAIDNYERKLCGWED